MATIDKMNKPVRLTNLDKLAALANGEITKVSALAADAFKSGKVEGNTVKFYTDKTPEEGATPTFSVDFPSEMVLDQAKTTFAPTFTFNAETYAGATDPELNGKPVLILAVKTVNARNEETVNYSFLDLAKLIDVYKIKTGDSAKVLKIENNEIEFILSSTDGNIIKITDNGLYATTRVEGAVQGNLAIFDADGAPADSGIASDTVVLTSMFASDAEVNEVLGNYFTLGTADTPAGGGE